MIKGYIKNNLPIIFPLLKLVNRSRLKLKKRINTTFFGPFRNQRLVNEWESVSEMHKGKVGLLATKEKLKIVFIVVHRSTWKCEKLYRIFENSERYDPLIFVAQDISKRSIGASEWSDEELKRSYDYFREKEYNVVKCVNDGVSDPKSRERQINELSPDVIILNNPHDLAGPEFGSKLLESNLSCYIPYHFEGTVYNNGQDLYNKSFHNKCWKVFSSHNTSFQNYSNVQAIKAKNVILSGHPVVDDIWASKSGASDPWKKQSSKKVRIIWAPHQVLTDGELPASSFLGSCDLFLALAKENSDVVQWCFKPHPLLRPNLEKHPDWGVERTNSYFREWENLPNGQLSSGEYLDLFAHSDAMIHDCYSFIIEYAFYDKPALFVMPSINRERYLNQFGKDALTTHVYGSGRKVIENFIGDLIHGQDFCTERRKVFIDRYLESIGSSSPSMNVFNAIDRDLSIGKSD